ncbi:MAG: signal recognition particle-docking protein FtsY [Alphaproteobacteria bacterium]|nr:MAG: signal recognition particle-docking protein FtsY [Alphaproteobacteria bacterium]
MFFQKIKEKLFGKKHDEQTIEELEDTLLQADVGFALSEEFIQKIKSSSKEPVETLKAEMLKLLQAKEKSFGLKKGLNIILVCGVNGSGKTTFIAKLCHFLRDKKVGVVAGDTFRAAAVEQLEVWANRLNVPLFKGALGEDPSSVVYKAIAQTKEKNDLDVLIIDTAGRLHTKDNLMMELEKIKRIIQKFDDTAPHETLLVLDATIGSNTYNQTENFGKVIPLTGLVMNKLDGTAKGGTLLKIAKDFPYPFYFIGVGEKKEDLKSFDAEYFIDHLL